MYILSYIYMEFHITYYNKIHIIPVLIFCILCNMTHATVAESPYVKLDLVKSIQHDDMIGLKIDLQSPWKTYWYDPGEAGIAPVFDWSDSKNVANVTVIWPKPVVETEPLLQNVYTRSLVIPVQIKRTDSTKPVTIDLKAFIGICAHICIPVDIHINKSMTHMDITYDF